MLYLPVQGKVQHGAAIQEDRVRIGELAEVAGTTSKALRFYEDQGLLHPAKRTPAGYRDFEPETVARIGFIHRGQAVGFTLAQIRQILDVRDHGQAPCGHVRDLLGARLVDIERQIAHLQVLHDEVVTLRDAASDPEPDTCSPEQVCRYL